MAKGGTRGPVQVNRRGGSGRAPNWGRERARVNAAKADMRDRGTASGEEPREVGREPGVPFKGMHAGKMPEPRQLEAALADATKGVLARKTPEERESAADELNKKLEIQLRESQAEQARLRQEARGLSKLDESHRTQLRLNQERIDTLTRARDHLSSEFTKASRIITEAQRKTLIEEGLRRRAEGEAASHRADAARFKVEKEQHAARISELEKKEQAIGAEKRKIANELKDRIIKEEEATRRLKAADEEKAKLNDQLDRTKKTADELGERMQIADEDWLSADKRARTLAMRENERSKQVYQLQKKAEEEGKRARVLAMRDNESSKRINDLQKQRDALKRELADAKRRGINITSIEQRLTNIDARITNIQTVISQGGVLGHDGVYRLPNGMIYNPVQNTYGSGGGRGGGEGEGKGPGGEAEPPWLKYLSPEDKAKWAKSQAGIKDKEEKKAEEKAKEEKESIARIFGKGMAETAGPAAGSWLGFSFGSGAMLMWVVMAALAIVLFVKIMGLI